MRGHDVEGTESEGVTFEQLSFLGSQAAAWLARRYDTLMSERRSLAMATSVTDRLRACALRDELSNITLVVKSQDKGIAVRYMRSVIGILEYQISRTNAELVARLQTDDDRTYAKRRLDLFRLEWHAEAEQYLRIAAEGLFAVIRDGFPVFRERILDRAYSLDSKFGMADTHFMGTTYDLDVLGLLIEQRKVGFLIGSIDPNA
jgi:hypothetical protein